MIESLYNLGTQWGLMAVAGLLFCVWWLVYDGED